MNSMHNSTPRGRRINQQPTLERHHQQSGGGRMRPVSRSRSRGRHPAAANGGPPVDPMGGGMRMNSTLVARSASPPLGGFRGMMDAGDDSMAYMIPGRAQMHPPAYQPRAVPEFPGGSPRGRYSPTGSRSRFRRVGGPHGSPTSSHSPSRYFPGRGRIKHSATAPITHSRRMNSEKGLNMMEMGHMGENLSPHRRIVGVDVHRDMRYRPGPYNPGGVSAKSMPLDGRMDAGGGGAVDCRPPGSRGGPPGMMPRDMVEDPMSHHRVNPGPVAASGPEAYVDSRGGPPVGMAVRGMGGGTPGGGQSRRTALTPRISDSAEKRIPSSGRRYNERYGSDVPTRPMPDRGPDSVRRNRSVMNDELSSPVSSSVQYGSHSHSGVGGMWRRNTTGGGGVWMRSPPSHHGGGGSVICRSYAAKPMTTSRTDDMLGARVQEMQARLEDMASENQVFRQVILDQTTRVWKLSQIVSRRGVDFCDDLSELSSLALQRPSAHRRSRKWRLIGGVRSNAALDNGEAVEEPNASNRQDPRGAQVGEVVVGSSGDTVSATTPVTLVGAGEGEYADGESAAAVGDGDESSAVDSVIRSHSGAAVVTAAADGDEHLAATSCAATRDEGVVDCLPVGVDVGGEDTTMVSSGSMSPTSGQDKLSSNNAAADAAARQRSASPMDSSRRGIATPAAKRVATTASWSAAPGAAAEGDIDSAGTAVTAVAGNEPEMSTVSAAIDSIKYSSSSGDAVKYDLMPSPQSGLRTPSVYWVNCQTADVDLEFRTIAEALITVPPHSTILIREGLYIESITLTNPIRLVGVGCDVQLLSDKGNGITVKCEGAVVQNLHIRCEFREFSLVHALDGEASRGLTSVSACLNGMPTGPGVGLLGNHCVSIYAVSFELDGCDLMTDRGHCIYCDPFGSAGTNRYGQRERRSAAIGGAVTDGSSKLSASGADDKLLHSGQQLSAKSDNVVNQSSSYAEDFVADEYTALDEDTECLNCDDDTANRQMHHNGEGVDDVHSDRRLSTDSKGGAKDASNDIDVEQDAGDATEGAALLAAGASTFINNDGEADADAGPVVVGGSREAKEIGGVVVLMMDEAQTEDNMGDSVTEADNADRDAEADDEDRNPPVEDNADHAGPMNDDLAVIDDLAGDMHNSNNTEGAATGNACQSCGDEADSVNSDVVEVVEFPNCTDQDAVLGNTQGNNMGDQDDHLEHRDSYSSSGRPKSASGANNSAIAEDHAGYATPMKNNSSAIAEDFNSEKYFADPSASGYPTGAIVCKNSRVHHASSCGLFVTGRCRVNIENTAIEACRMAGIEARDRARVTMTKCRITACTKSGVFGHGSAHVAMQATDVINCGMAGIELSKQSTGSLLDSRIYQGHKGGVFVHDYARASIKKCEIFANAMSNVDIRAHGKVEVIESTISESKTSGVYVSNKGEAFLHRNFICRNWGNGVELNAASLNAYHNQVHENHRCALFANGDCGGVIHHNDFRWNSDKSLSNHSRGRLPADGENNFVDSGDRRGNNN